MPQLAQIVDEDLAPPDRTRILEPIYESLGVSPPWIVDLLIAIALIVLSWQLAKVIVRYSGRPVARRFERPSVTRTVLQGIRVIVVVFALIFAARIVGFEAGEILLSVTVFSAVLAVVLAPIVSRFIGGLFVLADQPFEIGDMIELAEEGVRGYVEDVTLRYTKLSTIENTFIVVPNSTILERDVINYSAGDERTRQRIEFAVTYEGDLDRARELCSDAAKDVDGVIDRGPPIRVGSSLYPAAPVCLVDDFGDDGIQLALLFWIEKPYRLAKVRSDVLARIDERIQDAPVDIAYPHQHLTFDETSGSLEIRMADEQPDI